MKKILAAIAFFIIGAGIHQLQAQATYHSGIKGKQIKEHARIRHGIKSGELTYREAAGLRMQQAKIQHDICLSRADGIVTPYEREQIRYEQTRVSNNIYRQKHDCQYR